LPASNSARPAQLPEFNFSKSAKKPGKMPTTAQDPVLDDANEKNFIGQHSGLGQLSNAPTPGKTLENSENGTDVQQCGNSSAALACFN
jgi:hypothetical protein